MATKNVTFQKAPPTSQPGTLDVKQYGPQTPTPVSVQWGNIGGVLSNQADLSAALGDIQSDIDAHEANTNNPHSVTKAQVGLGNVDNTSDATKPVSGPQATYIANAISTAGLDYVQKTGDTMTGSLNFSKATTVGIGISTSDSPYINLQKGASGKQSTLASFTGANLRWQMQLGDTTAEGGSNSGSNFSITRYNDAGASIAPALFIARKNGYTVIGPGATRAATLTDANSGYAVLELNKNAAGQGNYVLGNTNGSLRWSMSIGDTTAEGGSDAGSNFSLTRYSDAGAPLGNGMLIARKNGQVFIGNGTQRAAALSDTSADVAIEMSKAVATANNRITGNTNGVLRWSMNFGDNTAESGSNAGSNLSITRFNDAGSPLAFALQINRSTGAATFGPGSGGGAVGAVNSSYLNLNKAGSGNSSVLLGTNNSLARWAIELGSTDAESGGNNGSKFAVNAYDDAGNYMDTPFRIERATRNAFFNKRVSCGEGYTIQAGSGAGAGPSVFNFNWTGSLQAWIDTTNVGTVTLTSDERVKQDVVDMQDHHAAFMAIVPKQYRWGDVGIFRDDGREYSGWSAQQLLACGFGHAVDGDITAVQENGDPQPASVQDRPILAQAVLEIQVLHDLVAELRAEINALKGKA